MFRFMLAVATAFTFSAQAEYTKPINDLFKCDAEKGVEALLVLNMLKGLDADLPKRWVSEIESDLAKAKTCQDLVLVHNSSIMTSGRAMRLIHYGLPNTPEMNAAKAALLDTMRALNGGAGYTPKLVRPGESIR